MLAVSFSIITNPQNNFNHRENLFTTFKLQCQDVFLKSYLLKTLNKNVSCIIIVNPLHKKPDYCGNISISFDNLRKKTKF